MHTNRMVDEERADRKTNWKRSDQIELTSEGTVAPLCDIVEVGAALSPTRIESRGGVWIEIVHTRIHRRAIIMTVPQNQMWCHTSQTRILNEQMLLKGQERRAI